MFVGVTLVFMPSQEKHINDIYNVIVFSLLFHFVKIKSVANKLLCSFTDLMGNKEDYSETIVLAMLYKALGLLDGSCFG